MGSWGTNEYTVIKINNHFISSIFIGYNSNDKNEINSYNLFFLLLIFRPYWRCYYSNTDAIIYVVDSADRDRIGISKEELLYMLRVRKIE